MPDWPTSYGSFNPRGWFQIENVRAEHGHRLIAGIVAILTLILAMWVWRIDPRRPVRWFAVATFGAVFAQALLGGLTSPIKRTSCAALSRASLHSIG